MILINTPDATYMCTANQCSKFPVGEDTGGFADAFAGLIDPSTIESEFGDLGDDVEIDVSSEEIAGVDATCFSASGGDRRGHPRATKPAKSASPKGACSSVSPSIAPASPVPSKPLRQTTKVPDDAFEAPIRSHRPQRPRSAVAKVRSCYLSAGAESFNSARSAAGCCDKYIARRPGGGSCRASFLRQVLAAPLPKSVILSSAAEVVESVDTPS